MPSTLQKSMQHSDSPLSSRWSFIEQWCQTVPAVGDANLDIHVAAEEQEPLTQPRPDTCLRKRGMDRAQSPSKRMKLSHRNRDDDDNRNAILRDPDLTGSSSSSITASVPELPPSAPRSIGHYTSSISVQSYSAASRTTTSTTKSRARSTSPTKKTQGLVALKKPIYHVSLDDNNKEQLPEDVRVLYNRLYDITVEHEGIAPWEVRDEINAELARPWRESWFRRRTGGEETPSTEEEKEGLRIAAVELRGLRDIKRAAWKCRERGRSEAAWNTTVHAPLLQLALDRPEYKSVGWEVFADKKMVDLALILDPPHVVGKNSNNGGRRGEEEEGKLHRLAHAIQRLVRSQPNDKQTINQSMYTPLLDWPIGISIETKAVGSNEEGRVQLAVWTAAWHERIKDLMLKAGVWSVDTRLITLPLLLIVEHNWALSFACDRGDRLEVVGDMTLGETASLKGLYTLVAVLRELAVWMQGPFAEWILAALELC
ncbi:hypothetical protein QBC34DRAFT_362321 [Podospora aff. communis PSN243]|uniref:PD-(D/E)XK nuclease-like domain-containing protein n=1 Tax=Podospora aff. communis PSN243 TaxID=3040156 RepID=A0AAV9G5B0_9PEZI|nr:hypothetical protein QBC34DRAFT_362321 [Podospora aff. communis PSN243]